jgi:hypothetical protein
MWVRARALKSRHLKLSLETPQHSYVMLRPHNPHGQMLTRKASPCENHRLEFFFYPRLLKQVEELYPRNSTRSARNILASPAMLLNKYLNVEKIHKLINEPC